MSQVIGILSQPAWQGAGALIAVVAVVLSVLFERHKHKEKNNETDPEPKEKAVVAESPLMDNAIVSFKITNADSENEYYTELAKHISNAKENVYRFSRGLHHERRFPIYSQILRAEEEVLRRGVDVTRIQTGTQVAASWADGYARLREEFPESFRIFADLDSVLLNDVCLIDPYGHDPVVNFLFETREPTPLGFASRPVVAIFIKKERTLAGTLADQLVRRAAELKPLTPQEIRDLSQKYIYFGWGVHMAPQKMQRDVPDARLIGPALLQGWRRDIRSMLAGPANRATIHETGDVKDSFDGVAYELSWWGKSRLDRLERRAYRMVTVKLKLNGKVQHAFTYVPLPPATAEEPLSPGSWIDLVIEGAIENNMTGLLDELRAAGVPIDAPRKDDL